MKRRNVGFIFAVMLVVVQLICILCAKPVYSYAASDPELNTYKKTMYTGSTYQLKISGSKDKVTWSSSNEKVARVFSDGLVVAVKKGSASIYAKVNGEKLSCKITVKNPSLSKSKASISVGSELQLKITGSNPVSWSSSNKSVATVSSTGNVTGISYGSTTIKVKCENGSTYSCKVTVKIPPVFLGDTVYFGKFEQDNDSVNGPEEISWTVAKIENEKALLVSDYILWYVGKDTLRKRWGNGAIRTELNETFYDTSFTAEEKRLIKTTLRDGLGEDSTEDKVFILSIEEAASDATILFSSRGVETRYAKTTGSSEDKNWLVISPDGVYGWGFHYDGGYGSYYNSEPSSYWGETYYGVRPAIWISID